MLQRFFDALVDRVTPDAPDTPANVSPTAITQTTAIPPVPFTIVFHEEPAGAPTLSAQAAPEAELVPINEAVAVRTPRTAYPVRVSEGLMLPAPRPSIAIMGGAGNMDEVSTRAVREIVEDALARFAQNAFVNIVDGGTAAGVMALMGEARARHGYTFPLVGVAPNALVRYPGFDNPDAQAALDARHTHFALTTGGEWGDESDMLAGLAYALAGGDHANRFPTLGLVINGGAVVKREAHARAVGPLRFPLLVLDGSGRAADEIAAAKRAGGHDDPMLAEIAAQESVYVQPLSAGADRLAGWLGDFFGR